MMLPASASGATGFRGVASLRGGIGQENPDVAVALGAFIAFGEEALDLDVGIGSKRRDGAALSRVRVKFPPVIAALDGVGSHAPKRKRHGAMRAQIGKRQCAPLRVASNGKRQLEESGGANRTRAEIARQHRGIPEAKKACQSWRLAPPMGQLVLGVDSVGNTPTPL